MGSAIVHRLAGALGAAAAGLASTLCLAGAPGLDHLNKVRAAAGLVPLAEQPQLAAAARRHAAYLEANPRPSRGSHLDSAHLQQRHLPAFSGTDPARRAQAAGYPHAAVRENLSVGYADAVTAIDGLMGAIYHRLVFLDPTLDEVGAAEQGRAHVFLLGRSDLRALCRESPPQALARAPVDCLGTRVEGAAYARLCDAIPAQARFEPPHARACPNGQQLDRGFVAGLCRRPPAGALLAGTGRYYDLCGDGRRFAAEWVEALCTAPPAGALYPHSGGYYEICDGTATVHADWLQQACGNLAEVAPYRDSGRYRLLCDPPREVRVEYLEGLDAAHRRAGPEFVLWPPEGAVDVPPAFFEEEPDPLPDRAVAGYPVSLQVDPERHGRVRLRSLSLYAARGDAWEAVRPTRLLDRASDPHGLLDAHAFALFPLRRLDWGREYVAVAELELDGEPRRLEWGFRTRAPGMPVLTAGRDAQWFEVRPGDDYALYLPPRAQQGATVATVTAERPVGARVEVAVLDPNTVRVKLAGAGCEGVRLIFGDGRRVGLRPRGCAAPDAPP